MTRTRHLLVVVGIALIVPLGALAGNETDDRSIVSEPPRFALHGYLDVGYAWSSTQPANHRWRSKGTTFVLDRLRINNATVGLSKGVKPTSRWGYRVGLQAGIDVDGQVPSEGAMSSAETLKHLWYTDVTYLAPAGRGLAITGGLLPGHPGYPSYYAIRNPSYTRPYSVDYVPYFFFGFRATYPAVDAPVSGSFYVVNGYNYLSHPNDIPSYGLQATWEVSPPLNLTQNFYYGSDQEATELEFWRFMSNSIVEWDIGSFLLAASFTFGTERQGAVPGMPRYDWKTGALWLQFRPTETWRFTARPEFFDDPDGLQTGARQTIGAMTATAEYAATPGPESNASVRLEYRFDRSTGAEGGFYEGADNSLVPNQHLLLLSMQWLFDHTRRPLHSR